MQQKLAEGSVLGVKYEIQSRAGTVNSTEQRTEVEVEGQVSGGGATGRPVSGEIKSKKTHYQTIHMVEDDGKEFVVELVNFPVTCREGQKLTLLRWGDSGPWIEAHNHNTGERYDNGKGLKSKVFPRWILTAAIALVAFIFWSQASGDPSLDGFERVASTFIMTAIVGLVIYGIAHIFAGVRASKVRGDAAIQSLRASLK